MGDKILWVANCNERETDFPFLFNKTGITIEYVLDASTAEVCLKNETYKGVIIPDSGIAAGADSKYRTSFIEEGFVGVGKKFISDIKENNLPVLLIGDKDRKDITELLNSGAKEHFKIQNYHSPNEIVSKVLNYLE
jgi:hypothetical protein